MNVAFSNLPRIGNTINFNFKDWEKNGKELTTSPFHSSITHLRKLLEWKCLLTNQYEIPPEIRQNFLSRVNFFFQKISSEDDSVERENFINVLVIYTLFRDFSIQIKMGDDWIVQCLKIPHLKLLLDISSLDFFAQPLKTSLDKQQLLDKLIKISKDHQVSISGFSIFIYMENYFRSLMNNQDPCCTFSFDKSTMIRILNNFLKYPKFLSSLKDQKPYELFEKNINLLSNPKFREKITFFAQEIMEVKNNKLKNESSKTEIVGYHPNSSNCSDLAISEILSRLDKGKQLSFDLKMEIMRFKRPWEFIFIFNLIKNFPEINEETLQLILNLTHSFNKYILFSSLEDLLNKTQDRFWDLIKTKSDLEDLQKIIFLFDRDFDIIQFNFQIVYMALVFIKKMPKGVENNAGLLNLIMKILDTGVHFPEESEHLEEIFKLLPQNHMTIGHGEGVFFLFEFSIKEGLPNLSFNLTEVFFTIWNFFQENLSEGVSDLDRPHLLFQSKSFLTTIISQPNETKRGMSLASWFVSVFCQEYPVQIKLLYQFYLFNFLTWQCHLLPQFQPYLKLLEKQELNVIQAEKINAILKLITFYEFFFKENGNIQFLDKFTGLLEEIHSLEHIELMLSLVTFQISKEQAIDSRNEYVLIDLANLFEIFKLIPDNKKYVFVKYWKINRQKFEKLLFDLDNSRDIIQKYCVQLDNEIEFALIISLFMDNQLEVTTNKNIFDYIEDNIVIPLKNNQLLELFAEINFSFDISLFKTIGLHKIIDFLVKKRHFLTRSYPEKQLLDIWLLILTNPSNSEEWKNSFAQLPNLLTPSAILLYIKILESFYISNRQTKSIIQEGNIFFENLMKLNLKNEDFEVLMSLNSVIFEEILQNNPYFVNILKDLEFFNIRSVEERIIFIEIISGVDFQNALSFKTCVNKFLKEGDKEFIRLFNHPYTVFKEGKLFIPAFLNNAKSLFTKTPSLVNYLRRFSLRKEYEFHDLHINALIAYNMEIDSSRLLIEFIKNNLIGFSIRKSFYDLLCQLKDISLFECLQEIIFCLPQEKKSPFLIEIITYKCMPSTIEEFTIWKEFVQKVNLKEFDTKQLISILKFSALIPNIEDLKTFFTMHHHLGDGFYSKVKTLSLTIKGEEIKNLLSAYYQLYLVFPQKKIDAIFLFLPPSQRIHLCTEIFQIFEKCSDQTKDKFFELIPLLPIKELETLLDVNSNRTVNELLIEHPSIREKIAKHILFIFDQFIADVRYMELFSTFIIQNFDFFGLMDREDVLLKGVEINSFSSREINNPKNPYSVHKFISQHESITHLIPFISEGEKIPGLPPESLPLAINIDGFRMLAKERYTAEMLPKTVSEKSFSILCESFTNRLNAFKIEEKEIVLKYMKDSYEKTFFEMLNFIKANSYLYIKILGVPRVDGQKISRTVYEGHEILEWIQESDTSIPKNEYLSEQESRLMRFLDALQYCGEGQEEGIHRFHHQVFAFSGHLNKINEQERILDFLSDIIFRAQDGLFASPSLHQELGHDSNHTQITHSAVFLKNLFSDQVGYPYKRKLDVFTNTIPDSYFKLDTKFMLKTFYRLLPPKTIFDIVLGAIAESFKNKNAGGLSFMDIQRFLESMHANVGGDWIYQYVAFNEHLEPVGITAFCAKEILSFANLVIEVPEAIVSTPQNKEPSQDCEHIHKKHKVKEKNL